MTQIFNRRFLIPMMIGLFSTASALAAGFPNDTHTKIASTGADCGAVAIESAFMTAYGENGARGYALVIQGSIQNLAYVKNVTIEHAGGWDAHVATDPNWNHNIATIFYRGQSGDRDRMMILDRSLRDLGPHDFKLKVTMNGTTFTCSATIAGPDPSSEIRPPTQATH